MLPVFGLNLLAFTALCLAMNRHHKNLLGHEPSASGCFCYAAWRCSTWAWHWPSRSTGRAWRRHRPRTRLLEMLAAGTLVLLLAWRPRWALPCAAGVPLLGGVLAPAC
ncbi:DUF3325 domain-containing protein [Pseudomonas aeruginosa]|nr:DUF3325 domain-containing protein [Pseudomonas aeruginosa]